MQYLRSLLSVGSWALVTGAARGLGAQFTVQLAQQGFNIILVDYLDAELQQQNRVLQTHYHCKTLALCLDLADEHCAQLIEQHTHHLDISLVINNAGLSSIGEFLQQSNDFLLQQLYVNTRAPLLITHYFTRRMKQQGGGGIILVSSGAAELPSALNATYSASKAYELKLAESLWWELKPYNIAILGFMPVATHTPGLLQHGYSHKRKLMTPTQCVNHALLYLGKTPSIMAGKPDRIIHQLLLKLTHRQFRIKLVSKEIKKMFGR